MRSVSVLALAIAAVSLGGCATGGSGTLDAVGLANDPSVCGLNCNLIPEPTGGGSPVGGGEDENGDKPPGAKNGNSGNDANFKGGDTTIAIEAGVVVTDYNNPSRSKLTRSSANKTGKFEIETGTANNALWAKAKTMDEYEFGSIYPYVIPYSTANSTDANGNNIPDGDTYGEELFANGIADPALGGTYKEYRSYIQDAKKPFDETLQVWTFDDSYVVQYRDETSGNDVADKAAWSFGTKSGGVQTKASRMPATRATASYVGKFGSTAITKDWENTENPLQKVSYNNSWRVRGTANGSVNFTTSRVSMRLTPEFWSTWADMNGYKGQVLVNANDFSDVNNPGGLYGNSFMQGEILLSGNLTKTKTGNSIKGKSSLDKRQGWFSDGTTGMFFGGLYGADADEITGIFTASGAMPAPSGGNLPLANPRRGRLSHSGGFNAKD